ncbi:MAG: response regulator [Gemmatimonas sp.]
MPNRNRSILIVDDNPATRYSTARILRHSGYVINEVSTGAGGVKAAMENHVDLVVLDIDLPDIDGFEVCRRIRANAATRRVRVIYLSASFMDDSHKVQGFEAGADAFLNHPVEPAVLIATVAALLRARAIEYELEQLLEREQTARAEAERANRAKDDFLATLSHELRSPLTAIVGWAEVARLQSEDHPQIQNALQVIERNAKLQSQLISDLLDISRITTGSFRMDMAPVWLSDIMKTSVDSLQASAEKRRIVLEYSIDNTVGAVRGDSARLYQIISNVLSNAIKFSETGGVVKATLRKATDDVAEIVIEDSGRGIPASVLPRVFDRFWQEDTTSRRSHGGLGIGLSIVKHLTEMHGGSVVAVSDGEGLGSRFTLTLPLLPSDVVMPDPAHNTGEMEAIGHAMLESIRVMLIDDEPDGREWVRLMMANAGAETMDVGSVDEALSAVDTFDPHVIVSDLGMPGKNGFDFVTELRERGHGAARLPVLALSAFASADDKMRALEAGFQSFMSKPPDAQELLRAVRRLARSVERG